MNSLSNSQKINKIKDLFLIILVVYSVAVTLFYLKSKNDCFIKYRTVEVVYDNKQRIDYDPDYLLANSLFETLREKKNPVEFYTDSLQLDSENIRMLRHYKDYKILVLPTWKMIEAPHYIVTKDTLYEAVFLPVIKVHGTENQTH